MTEATFESKCAACGDAIQPGDDIEQNDDGDWIHETCADEDRAEG